MADSERGDGSAMLVGRLTRSYRDDGRRNGRRLSQDGLLDLMVERGEGYAAKLDRTAISHWELARGLDNRRTNVLSSFL